MNEEELVRIKKILTWSDIHPSDCTKINDLITRLSKENQQLKERITYLENSNNRREETIINLRHEQQLDLYKEVLIELKAKILGLLLKIDEQDFLVSEEELEKLLQILDKVKEDK